MIQKSFYTTLFCSCLRTIRHSLCSCSSLTINRTYTTNLNVSGLNNTTYYFYNDVYILGLYLNNINNTDKSILKDYNFLKGCENRLYYLQSFSEINKEHLNEIIKLEEYIHKGKPLLKISNIFVSVDKYSELNLELNNISVLLSKDSSKLLTEKLYKINIIEVEKLKNLIISYSNEINKLKSLYKIKNMKFDDPDLKLIKTKFKINKLGIVHINKEDKEKLNKKIERLERRKKKNTIELNIILLKIRYFLSINEFKDLLLTNIQKYININKQEQLSNSTYIKVINFILSLNILEKNHKQMLIEYYLSNYQEKWYDYNKDLLIKIDLKILHKCYNILLNYIEEIKKNHKDKLNLSINNKELKDIFLNTDTEKMCNVIISNILNLNKINIINQTELALRLGKKIIKLSKIKTDELMLLNLGIYLIDIVIRKTNLIEKIFIQTEEKNREVMIQINKGKINKIEQEAFDLNSSIPLITNPKNPDNPWLTNDMNDNYDGIIHKSVENLGKTSLNDSNIKIINYLNNQKFKINKDVLKFIDEELNNPQSILINKIHPKTNEMKNLSQFKYRKQVQEILQHNSKYYQDYNTFMIAKLFQNETIYFLHYYDWRGRIYVLQNYLSYQGNDLARSLLLFEKESLITPKNEEYLMIHGATTYGLDKKSFNYRINFVKENQEHILNLNKEFISKAKEPFQFYAFCITWKNYIEAKNNNKSFYSGLPILFDCTCSGLQHLASIIQSNTLAQQVNLLTNTKDNDPYDIYQICADELNKKFIGTPYEHILINRKIMKLPIMIKSYNVTLFGIEEYVTDLFFKTVWNEELDKYEYIAKQVKPGFNKKTMSKKDVKYISKCVYDVLYILNPELNKLLNYFNDMVKVLNKLDKPIIWITPNNMKIVQKYHKFESKKIKITSLEKGIKLNDVSLSFPTDKINKIKQIQGFMPNHVHSIDGSAVQLLILSAISSNIPIFSIHDCFGTTLDNIIIMNELIRNAFIKIYSDGTYLNKLHNSLIDQISSYTDIYSENDSEYILNNKNKVYIPKLPPKGHINFKELKEAIYLIC